MLVVKSQRVVSLCNYFVIFIYLDPVLLYLRPSRGFPSCRGRYKHSNSSLRPRDSSFVIASTTVSGQEAQAFIPTLQLQSSFAISGSTLSFRPCTFFQAILFTAQRRPFVSLCSLLVACSLGWFCCLLSAHHTLWSVVLSTAFTFLLAHPVTNGSLWKVTHDGCPACWEK